MTVIQYLTITPILGGFSTGGGTDNPFAMTLVQYIPMAPINYTISMFIKLFNSAAQALPVIFYGKSNSINIFNNMLLEIPTKLGWMVLGEDVIMITDSNQLFCNIITKYG